MSRYFKDPSSTNRSAGNVRKLGRKPLVVENVYQDSDEINQVSQQLAQLKKEHFESRKDSDDYLFNSAETEILNVASRLSKLKRDHLLKSVANENAKGYSADFQSLVLKELLNTIFGRQPNIDFSEIEVKRIFNNFKDANEDELYKDSLRFVLLNYFVTKNDIDFPDPLEKPQEVVDFESLVLDFLFPFIRKALTLYVTDFSVCSVNRVAINIQALTLIYLFTWYDSKTDLEIDNDISVLFKILESTDNDVIFQSSLAAVTLLTFFSENWFDSIEDSASRLFEIYQSSSLKNNLLIGKALAFFYSIYDYSEQYADLKISKENSAPYMLNIPTIDNAQLFYEISQTSKNLRLSTETDFTDDHLFEKVQSSINASLILADTSEPISDDYESYEQAVLKKIKSLKISVRNDGIDHSWLQALVYPTLIWLFESRFDTELRRSTLVSNVYYSLSAFSVSWSRTSQRLNLFRYTHINDPKFIKSAHIEQARSNSPEVESHVHSNKNYKKTPKELKKIRKHDKNLLHDKF